MAEIKIQKRRNQVWIWIMALVLVAVIIWILSSYFNFTKKEGELAIFTDSTEKHQEEVLDSSVVSKINDFDLFVNNPNPGNNITDYTKEGLRKLSAVLNTMIKQNDTLQSNFENQQDTLRKNIDNMESYSDNSKNCIDIKNAFLSCAGLIQSIQEKNYDSLANRVAEVKYTAQSIDAMQPIRTQENKIKEFFKRSDIVLKLMEPKNVTVDSIK